MIDCAAMPAALQPLGVVVGREIAGERAEPLPAGERARRRLEHRRLAGARRAHQVDRDHAARAEVLAIVRAPCVRCRRGSARAPRPARSRDRRSHRCRTSRHLHLDPIEHDFVARRQPRRRCRSVGQRSGCPAADRARRSRGHAQRAATMLDVQLARPRRSSVRGTSRRRSSTVPTSTPDSSPIRTDSRCTAGRAARARFRVDALDQRLNDRVLVHRLPHCGEARRRVWRRSCRVPPRTRRRRRCGCRCSSSRSRWTSSRSMPAAWLISPLATPNASGRARGERLGHARAPPRRTSRSGNTSLTRPSCERALASSRGLSSTSSIARRKPTSRGSMNVELSAPVRPGLRVRPLERRALATRTTRSQHIARPNPPAAAMPSTAAMNGFGARRISEMVLCRYSRICLKRSP